MLIELFTSNYTSPEQIITNKTNAQQPTLPFPTTWIDSVRYGQNLITYTWVLYHKTLSKLFITRLIVIVQRLSKELQKNRIMEVVFGVCFDNMIDIDGGWPTSLAKACPFDE